MCKNPTLLKIQSGLEVDLLIWCEYVVVSLYAKIKVRLLLCANPYSAALITRHSTLYPNSLKQVRIIPKSLPRWFEGDFNKRSTFSRITKLGDFSSRMSRISHHKTPFYHLYR